MAGPLRFIAGRSRRSGCYVIFHAPGAAVVPAPRCSCSCQTRARQEELSMFLETGFTTTEPDIERHRPRPRVDRDRELIEALRCEDPRAAERLLEIYGARAYRLAVRITRAPQDAEEVVQDALLRGRLGEPQTTSRYAVAV